MCVSSSQEHMPDTHILPVSLSFYGLLTTTSGIRNQASDIRTPGLQNARTSNEYINTERRGKDIRPARPADTQKRLVPCRALEVRHQNTHGDRDSTPPWRQGGKEARKQGRYATSSSGPNQQIITHTHTLTLTVLTESCLS